MSMIDRLSGKALEYVDMIQFVPEEIRNPEHPKHRAIYGLIQNMARSLEEARRISMLPVREPDGFGGYMRGNSALRVRRVQEQMSAVRFRLNIRDFKNPAEAAILEQRLFDLYEEAKRIDPEGTARFERMVDKRMRRSR